MSDITVKQVRSAIGTKPKHRGTLRALGLGKIGNTNTLPDRPEIRGMIARVPHLIEVSEDAASSGPQGSTKNNQQGQAAESVGKLDETYNEESDTPDSSAEEA